MKNLTVSCKKCNKPFPPTIYNKTSQKCPICKTQTEAYIFPAFFREQPILSLSSFVEENEASCYYHHDKKAIRVCDSCGSFMCYLCDIEINNKHFCPTCLEKGKQKQKIKTLENSCILYDNIALYLAFVPLLLFIFLFWMTIITAPMAIYVAIRYWKNPCGVISRTKLRFVLSIILSLIQIGGWFLLVFELVFRRS